MALKYSATKLSNLKGGDLRFILEQTKIILNRALNDTTEKDSCTIKFEHSSAVLIKLNKSLEGSDIMKTLPLQQSIALIAIYLIYTRD